MAGQPWDASYHDGPAPWDVGRPQPAIPRLAGEGAFAGAVLDAGCGTGENALHVASLGLQVLGVDVAETALSIAREKAAGRGIDADFEVADALHLDRLGRVFETVRTAFKRGGGWSVASVSPDRILTTFNAQGAPAWLAKIERI